MQNSRTFPKATLGIAQSIALIALFGLVGCASKGPLIRSDYDRTVDFSALHTFGFPTKTGTDRGGYATLITSHFKEAIKREMTVRGYTFAETNPDMLVNFYSESREKTEVYSHPSAYMGMGYGFPGYGYPGYGYPRYGWYSAFPFYSDVDVVSYTQGVLKIDVIDAKREQTIWEAHVEEKLTDKAQDNPQPTIARLVTAMFARFPYGASAAAAKNAKN